MQRETTKNRGVIPINRGTPPIKQRKTKFVPAKGWLEGTVTSHQPVLEAREPRRNKRSQMSDMMTETSNS